MYNVTGSFTFVSSLQALQAFLQPWRSWQAMQSESQVPWMISEAGTSWLAAWREFA